jgi:hypothetical protein
MSLKNHTVASGSLEEKTLFSLVKSAFRIKVANSSSFLLCLFN